jgi:protein SCO1
MRRMTSRLHRVGALLLAASALAAAAATAAAAPPAKFVGPRIVHPSVAPDFTLRDQTGRLVRLAAQRGNVVLVTFLYTNCPDLCPLTADHVNEALDRLGRRSKNVTALAITVDPKGDTPSAVRRFVRAHEFKSQFRYLTGSRRALARIWRLYNVTPVSRGVDPDHTLYVLLLDRRGRTRVLFDALARPAAIAHDLRVLVG